MSDLVSMLVPLQTMPGWNNVDPVSPLWILLLVLGIPLAVGLIVTVIGMGRTWVRGSGDDGPAELTESVWMGEGPQPKAVAASAPADENVGGASVRW